jgi:hypothetical protein
MRDARGHDVTPVKQAPGERIGQSIVHRHRFYDRFAYLALLIVVSLMTIAVSR